MSALVSPSKSAAMMELTLEAVPGSGAWQGKGDPRLHGAIGVGDQNSHGIVGLIDYRQVRMPVLVEIERGHCYRQVAHVETLRLSQQAAAHTQQDGNAPG